MPAPLSALFARYGAEGAAAWLSRKKGRKVVWRVGKCWLEPGGCYAFHAMEKTVSHEENADYDFSILRELRNQYKITLEGLAEATGISFSTLTRIESNQNRPSLATLKRLADFFGMTPAHLLELTTSFIVERRVETRDKMGTIKRRSVAFSELRLRAAQGKAGQSAEEPHLHVHDYQVTWVLEGRMVLNIHGKDYELPAGHAIHFDAGFAHSSRLIEDSVYVVALMPKRTK